MATNLAVLERAPKQAQGALKDRLITPAEEEHAKKIADNYRMLRFENAEAYNSAMQGDVPSAPVRASVAVAPVPVREEVSAPSTAASRIAQYKPVAAPAKKAVLFENVSFKDGKLQTPAASQASESMVASMPASAPAMDDEDALPTRRTMDTLYHPMVRATAEAAVAAPRTSVLAALSTKTKIAVMSVIAAIIVAIMIICINTSVINGMSASISAKEAQLAQLQEQSAEVQQEIDKMLDPDYVAWWAEEVKGMVKKG